MVSDETVAPQVESILQAARRRQPPTGRVSVQSRSLPTALAASQERGHRPVIAELKPTSPTTSTTRDVDPVATATAMVAGGAAAISVLTEPEHFGGSPTSLAAIRDAVDVPVLRKDFILEPAQLDAVAADLVLVIARFVDDLPGLLEAARDRGFQPLVEVHTVSEFRAAVAAGATIVGINNRDLRELTVDLSTVETVLATVSVPDDLFVIAESGIHTPVEADRMLAAGADGLLIGSAVMAPEPQTVAKQTARLTGVETIDV